MASLLTVRLSKGDSPNWGFRLQGGKDFATPLIIQKVIVGSPAERAGLVAGDSVIRVNNTDVFNLRHKDAQDVLLRAGGSFDMTIQRGGSTWKPAVIPTGSISSHSPTVNNISPVTRTSLAAKPSENIGAIGTGHNVAAKPFLNGTLNGGPKLVNSQYNSPLKLYSEESIAETLSAQTEVLSTGALGVNFKKNEKNYDASKSAVLSFLKEEESSPRSPEHIDQHSHQVSSGIDSAPSPVGIAGLRRVTAPENKPQPPSPQLPPGQNVCADCERLIVGVFVRIKDKNLHVECFKCSTCGTSLKNVGYYNINNKLYCDIHAKLAARNNPPAPNLVPITVPPGGKAPAHAISAALASHPYPTSAPLSPKINSSYQAPSSGPKPFGSVPGPLSPAANFNSPSRTGAPLSPVAPISAPSYSPVPSSVVSVSNVVWPPVQEEPDIPSACPLFYPPPSKIIIKPRTRLDSENSELSELEEINRMNPDRFEKFEEMSYCSGRRSATECVETIAETVERQMLVENIMKSRPQPKPDPEIPRGSECTKTATSGPEMECKKFYPAVDCPMRKKEAEMSIPSTREEKLLSSKIDYPVPQKWESQMLQALTISVEDLTSVKSSEVSKIESSTTIDSKTCESTLEQSNIFATLPTKKTSTALGTALSVAPSEPFNPVQISYLDPVPLPEETVPYFPPDDLFTVPINTTANEPDKTRPFRKKKDPNLDKIMEDLPKPQSSVGKLSMRAALTTAPERPFTPAPSQEILETSSHQEKEVIDKTEIIETKRRVIEKKPDSLPLTAKTESTPDLTPVSPESLPLFQGFTCSFQNKADLSQFDIQISTSPPLRERKSKKDKQGSANVRESQQTSESEIVEKSVEIKTEQSEKILERTKTEKKGESKKQKKDESVTYKRPEQMVTLRKPQVLPQYQKSVGDNAEADLIMQEKMRKREEERKLKETQKIQQTTEIKETQQASIDVKMSSSQTSGIQRAKTAECPKIEVVHSPDNSFKPVIDSRPQSCSMSQSSRPLTPSMVNKPASVLPYYQANLVAQKYGPATVKLLDPRSPGISRTPSPSMEKPRHSQLSERSNANIRPKSPAQGPPVNPLHEEHVPTREDFKMEEAKDSLTTFIPQYKEKLELSTGRDSRNEQRIAFVASDTLKETTNQLDDLADLSNRTSSKTVDFDSKQEIHQTQQVADSAKQETRIECSKGIESTTKISEKKHMEKLDEFKRTEQSSVEKSRDGSVQVERKKIVTEEFEHSKKSLETSIEKNSTITSRQGFRNVKNPEEDNQHVVGLHVTAPNRIQSPFIKSSQGSQPPKITTVCQKVGIDVPCTKTECEDCSEQKQCPRFPEFDAKTLPKPASIPEPLEPSIPESTIVPPKPIKRVIAPGSSSSSQKLNPTIPTSDVGAGGGRQTGAIGTTPKRGRGVLNTGQLGGRVALCGQCHGQIRGPFITALGKIWCPNHFICSTPSCRRPLQDMGFVEERGQLYCEYCFEQYLAPNCAKCGSKIKGDCLKAIGKDFHPECFNCVHCGKHFGNNPFFLEDGSPYCETDWNEFFTTKCFACGFPVEAGDRWVEALNNNYHSQCFNCTMCKKNLEGQSFFAKGGRPYCKNHAR